MNNNFTRKYFIKEYKGKARILIKIISNTCKLRKISSQQIQITYRSKNKLIEIK